MIVAWEEEDRGCGMNENVTLQSIEAPESQPVFKLSSFKRWQPHSSKHWLIIETFNSVNVYVNGVLRLSRMAQCVCRSDLNADEPVFFSCLLYKIKKTTKNKLPNISNPGPNFIKKRAWDWKCVEHYFQVILQESHSFVPRSVAISTISTCIGIKPQLATNVRIIPFRKLQLSNNK